MSEIDQRELTQGDEEFARVVEMVEAMRAAIVPMMLADQSQAGDNIAVAMTAASVFAGSHFGTLLALGVASNQDRRRAVEAATRNFRTGIDIGLRRGLRIGTEISGGTA